MALTPDDIKHVAHLARLDIPQKDIAAVTSKMSQIMGLVDQINQYDTKGHEPMAHPLTDMTQRLRPDVVTMSDEREAHMKNAPESEAGLFLVPQVIDTPAE